jgi:8-oxo-dGTP pyrophosphatase MutT (NUDIX family)
LKNKYLFNGTLKPNNAICAIIKYKDNFLIQKRDNKKNIFFPDHYGLFGGAIEKNETKLQALIRELYEEIGIKFKKKNFKFLTSLVLDFRVIGHKKYTRWVYTINLNKKNLQHLSLGEGAKMVWVSKNKIYKQKKLIPYDKFAFWLYLFNK